MDAQVWVEIDDIDVETARQLALARLTEVQRQQSVHRPTARNVKAQYRGAAGELAARNWLRSRGLSVDSGFEDDRPQDSDLTVGGHRIEVMTAQIAHRRVTGFCVPPGKFRAAQRRGAIGYLFIGTGPEDEPRRFLVQGFCQLSRVALADPVPTRVSERSPAVTNHVVAPENIDHPELLLAALEGHRGC